MLFHSYFLSAFLAASLVSASSFPDAFPGAIPRQATQPTRVPLPHRVSAGGAATETPLPRSLQERQAKQIPFQFCPEFFGDPPKLCSLCGGDSKVPGVCDNLLVSGDQSHCPYSSNNGCLGYFCKCTDDGTDNSPKVTTTTVVSGVTGTVVWEPLTLTEYASLRASTTVTLTETATATQTDSEVETVVAVVFAGGICWWVASQAGSSAAVLLIEPPTAKPDGSKEDDTTCKSNPKEDCANCGGADSVGLCKTGSEAGCPCDEQEQKCPSEPPLCSDASCGGDNGSSQCSAQGAINGCTCCADAGSELDCSDSKCGSTDNTICASDTQKGCACNAVIGSEDISTNSDGPDYSPADIASAAQFALTNVWAGNTASIPGFATTSTAVATPWCQHGAAPHNTRLPAEYCMCGPNGAIYYSVATGTNPCPYTGTPGPTVTWTTPGAGTTTTPPTTTPPTTTPPTTTPPTTTAPSKTCDPYWCGAPFCGPCP